MNQPMSNYKPHSLSNDEIDRYSRQLILPEIGVAGQERMKSSRVLIAGAGGLGCPVAIYLAASGIGKISIVDYDNVERNNLHRQVLHNELKISQSKAASACDAIRCLNSLVEAVPICQMLNSENAMDLVRQHDVIVDCTDNAATRYLLNDAAVLAGKPLVSGSALRWEGQLSTYHYEDGPCYRCLNPRPPPPNLVTNCAEGGVLGSIPGVIGTLQALEVQRICAGLKPNFAKKLLHFDGSTGQFRTIQLRKRRTDCEVCGENPVICELIDYENFCQAGACDKIAPINLLPSLERISAAEYNSLRNSASNQLSALIDVRPRHEFDIARLENSTNIPIDSLISTEFDQTKLGFHEGAAEEHFIICHRGNDSQIAVLRLRQLFPHLKFRDVIGGFEAWSQQIDKDFPRY